MGSIVTPFVFLNHGPDRNLLENVGTFTGKSQIPLYSENEVCGQ